MKKHLQGLLSAGGAIIVSSHAAAVLQGLVVTPEVSGGGPPPSGGPRVIYNVYAQFDSPTDRVNVWGGGGEMGPATLQNVLANGNLGTGFTNIGGPGGQLAPETFGTTRDWDSYMTVGIRWGPDAPDGNDATTMIPGTPVFIPNNVATWTTPIDGGGVFITPDNLQGRADWRVTGNDTDTRVLLMQLVVHAGQFVKGTIGMQWSVDGVIGSGHIVAGLTFNNAPAPGTLLSLTGAAMIPMRRRRRR